MVEHLVRKRLVRRVRSAHDRRTVKVHLAESGHHLVGLVTDRRRVEIECILEHLPARGRDQVAAARGPSPRRPAVLRRGGRRSFAEAAGESPVQNRALGWDL